MGGDSDLLHRAHAPAGAASALSASATPAVDAPTAAVTAAADAAKPAPTPARLSGEFSLSPSAAAATAVASTGQLLEGDAMRFAGRYDHKDFVCREVG